MSIHKDIQYKKDNNETWSDWNNRFDNNEHKRDYIYDTIYTYCKSTLEPLALDLPSADMKIALEITDIIINIDIKDLIILLENTELLNEKIKEVYKKK
jgi:hypothetical protein